MTVLLSGWIANVVADVIATRSLGGAVLTSASLVRSLVLRAAILVPVSGGVVTLARRINRRLKRARPAPSADR